MSRSCPYCNTPNDLVVRCGSYYRKSDSQHIQRWRCHSCKKSFSSAFFFSTYKQKKRHKNNLLRKLLCSGVSQRRAAKILNLHRTTITRKFLFLSLESHSLLLSQNLSSPKAHCIEFDDLETFEHTKCKPLSITLAVESKSRRILGLSVSNMSVKGRLVKKALYTYGSRKDERRYGRRLLFKNLKSFIKNDATIKSDSNPHYSLDIAKYFPNAQYKQYLGKRGSIVGQGELKRVRFDPLFSLNHTCAKLRADVNRLFRKTWCTTKSKERLAQHLILYSAFHNEQILSNP